MGERHAGHRRWAHHLRVQGAVLHLWCYVCHGERPWNVDMSYPTIPCLGGRAVQTSAQDPIGPPNRNPTGLH